MTRRIFFANPDVLRTIRTIRPSKFHPLAGPGGRGSGRATRKGAGPRRGWLVKDWDSLRRRFGHDGGESATPVGVGDPSSAKPPALARSSLEHRRRLFFFVIRTRSLALLYPFLSLSLSTSLSLYRHTRTTTTTTTTTTTATTSSCRVPVAQLRVPESIVRCGCRRRRRRRRRRCCCCSFPSGRRPIATLRQFRLLTGPPSFENGGESHLLSFFLSFFLSFLNKQTNKQTNKQPQKRWARYLFRHRLVRGSRMNSSTHSIG